MLAKSTVSVAEVRRIRKINDECTKYVIHVAGKLVANENG